MDEGCIGSGGSRRDVALEEELYIVDVPVKLLTE
jgi:hypothetical protein